MTPISKCIICDAILRNSLAKYCRRCGNLVEKIDTRVKADIAIRVNILRKAWDKDSECFRCYYSGIPLEDSNPSDHRYLTFDRSAPGKEGELVITARLISDMKYGMSADEFKTIINQLSKHFEDGTPVDETIFNIRQHRR